MTHVLAPHMAFDALSATWPPAAQRQQDGWTHRNGDGGGKRVSATTRAKPTALLTSADDAPLFMLRPGEEDLDDALAHAGYTVVDPTLIRAAPLAGLDTAPDPDRWVIEGSHRLHMMERIWAGGGIGPARLAVMDRVAGPKAFLMGRDGDTPAATAFVACHGPVAMMHALEVLPAFRRQGFGHRMTRAAAHWAAAQGAQVLALAVVAANDAANALYARFGLPVQTRYHYRQQPDQDAP